MLKEAMLADAGGFAGACRSWNVHVARTRTRERARGRRTRAVLQAFAQPARAPPACSHKRRGRYIISTPLRIERLPVAELHYIGDRDLFWRNRALVHDAFLRTMGVVDLALDRRFADQRAVGFAFRRPAMRLHRPGIPAPPVGVIDTLFSELMTVKI